MSIHLKCLFSAQKFNLRLPVICFQQRLQNSTSSDLSDVVIPKKIPRGPTDILRALESTVGTDPTAAHYKYHDDPYLIPRSNLDKRTLALAKEAGKKAAHWVRKENVDLFQHRDADPFIELYAPPKIYTNDSEVTLDDLKKCIEDVQVTDAIFVYNLLKNKGIEVDQSVLQDFLELLCFYNSSDTLSEEFIEERWFKQSAKGDERQRKTWKDGAFAEEVFISIKEPNERTYCTLIQGMAKYYQMERASQLLEEAKNKGYTLSTNTYNSMIEAGSFLKENYDLRWTYVAQLLTEMNEKNLKPNIGTLNAVLYVLSSIGNKNSRDLALKSLAEFKRLGIEPSLASWYFILQIFCKEQGPTCTILVDILKEIENKEHAIKDVRDVNFFVTAMRVCRHHLNDLNLGRRVDALLHYGNNYDLIGDSYKESIYYRHYFILAINSEPINDFMEKIYERLVPHIYTPELGIFQELLKHVEVTGAVEYLPKLWSDVVTFDFANKEKILSPVLDIMVTNIPAENPELLERFSNIANDIYDRLINQDEKRTNKITITGNMLGNIMVVFLKNNQFKKGWEVFLSLDKLQNKIVGVPTFESLSTLIEYCIIEKQPSKGILCLQFASDVGFADCDVLARRLQEKLTLDETHINRIAGIVGQHAVVNKKSDE